MSLTAVILAAGKGTRMKSNLPKVLHEVNGKPMLAHVISEVKQAGATVIILVIGHGSEKVRERFGEEFRYVIQQAQLGTGHAVMIASEELKKHTGDVLLVCGDTPLLTSATLQALYTKHKVQDASCTILTANLEDPYGYGRILRTDKGEILKIVEEKDATDLERKISEINTGSYCFKCSDLLDAIKEITPNNTQGEYYLTDVIVALNNSKKIVTAYITPDFEETLGINSKAQLAEAARILRARKIQELMLAGVTVIDPNNTYIEDEVEIGIDTIIYPTCFIGGKTKIGPECEIGPGCKITDSLVGGNCEIQYSVLKDVKIGNDCIIGPYAYLRPGTVLADRVKVGDFAEVKNSFIGEGSKIPHLSYVGDAKLGKGVNIGAGTITCNYDGVNKYQTVVQDGAFIGSNTNLVAPVTIGANAVTGAGSTITKDVPPGALAVERAEQKIRKGYFKGK